MELTIAIFGIIVLNAAIIAFLKWKRRDKKQEVDDEEETKINWSDHYGFEERERRAG